MTRLEDEEQMKKNSGGKSVQSGGRLFLRLARFTLGVAVLAAVAGCETEPSPFKPATPAITASFHPDLPEAVNSVAPVAAPATNNQASYALREGDVLKISFPGSPNLNNVQPIRPDGKINLALVGEVQAAGMTPEALQQKLMDLYASQLTSKEITVEVQSFSFPVYVTGAVLRPGKISTDHPITALEAIMEAGGPDYTKANLKNVKIIRQEGSQTKNYILDLKRVMDGKITEPFYLKPTDIIYVPEKFSWF